MSTGKRYALIFVGLVAVVAAGGLAAYFSSDSRAKDKSATKEKSAKGLAAVPVSVVLASQQTVPVRLQAIGNVEPYTSVAVKSRIDGQILEIQFREGQEVKKGQVLFRIDPRPLEAAFKQSEAQSLKSRGDEYRKYQKATSRFVPLPPKDRS